MNIADSKKRWYALNVFNNKVMTADETLRNMGIETYVPVKVSLKPRKGGIPEEVRTPAVSRLMFVHTSASRILEIERSQLLQLRIYRTLESDPFDRKLVVIPDREMQSFILVSSCGEQGLEYFSGGEMTFRPGSKVRVIEGPFKGSVGHIKRIKGNRRLVVEIQGICAVATSYIPTPFLEHLPD